MPYPTRSRSIRLVTTLRLDTQTPTTYYFSDQEVDALPQYVAKILGVASLDKSAPDPLNPSLKGGVSARSAQVRLSNLPVAGDSEGVTVSYLRSIAEDVLGAAALLTLTDTETSTDLLTLRGIVSGIVSLTETEATLEITEDDPSRFQQALPKLSAQDIFPGIDLSTVPARDYPVVVAQGTMRKASLGLCHAADSSDWTFTLTGAGDRALYIDLTHVPNYAVQLGDVLVYDVVSADANPQVGIDLICTDSTQLASTAAADQNGLAAAPVTDLGTRQFKRWYRRKIPLAPASGQILYGKTLRDYLVVCQSDTISPLTASIANAQILDSSGALKVSLIDRYTPTLTTAVNFTTNAGNTYGVTKDNYYYYGPLRHPPSAALSVATVYRNLSVVPSAEYTTVTRWGLYDLVRFTDEQRDIQGNLTRIQADLTTTEFINPATAVKFWLSDADYGLGLGVDASSFSTAASAFTTLGYRVDGGLDQKMIAQDLLSQLSLHGLRLERVGTAGLYAATVDTAALHTQLGINLATYGVQGLANLDAVEVSPVRIADRLKKLTLHGLYDPTDGDGAWLLRTTRSRSVLGVERDDEDSKLLFVYDPTTLDKECDYRFKLATAADLRLKAVVSLDDILDYAIALDGWTYLWSPRHYIANQAVVVRGFAMDGARATLEFMAYDANVYSYTVGTDQHAEVGAQHLTDYSHTVPGTMVNFGLVSVSTRPGESFLLVQAGAPSVNVTDLVFRLFVGGETTELAQLVMPVSAGQSAVQAKFACVVGNLYDLWCHARNQNNLPNYRNGAVAQLTGVQAPFAPARLSLRTV